MLVATAPASFAAPTPDAPNADAAVDTARRESERVTTQYFAELDAYEVLGTEIAAIEDRITDIRGEADGLRAVVRARAVEAYKNGGGRMEIFLDGRGIADVTRTAKLMAAANARDDRAVDDLRTVTEDLDRRRDELGQARRARTVALDSLESARRRVDANLRAAVADRDDVVARLAAQAEAEAAEADQRAVDASGSGSTSTSGAQSAASPPPRRAQPPPAPAPPSSGAHPRHDDPFLSCVRHRESRGNYGVVNPAGPWRGAYQFLQSTWNTTAVHAGRSELVGVLANTASVYDQDDMAWTLYQWQGTGPWGGGC